MKSWYFVHNMNKTLTSDLGFARPAFQNASAAAAVCTSDREVHWQGDADISLPVQGEYHEILLNKDQSLDSVISHVIRVEVQPTEYRHIPVRYAKLALRAAE
jgi:hypothetical protein